MINAKTTPYIVYFLVAAVILFALAAIIASRSGGSSAEAQYTTCSMTLDDQNFDLNSIKSGPVMSDEFLTTQIIEARISNFDFHVKLTQDSDTFEVITVDNVTYVKSPTGALGARW